MNWEYIVYPIRYLGEISWQSEDTSAFMSYHHFLLCVFVDYFLRGTLSRSCSSVLSRFLDPQTPPHKVTGRILNDVLIVRILYSTNTLILPPSHPPSAITGTNPPNYHPWKLTRNLKIIQLKRKIIFQPPFWGSKCEFSGSPFWFNVFTNIRNIRTMPAGLSDSMAHFEELRKKEAWHKNGTTFHGKQGH